MLSAPIIASASGTASVIAGAANTQIKVYGYVVVCNTNVGVQWQSNTTTLSGSMPCGATGGVSVSIGRDSIFDLAAGNSLIINLSSAVAVGGHVSYTQN